MTRLIDEVEVYSEYAGRQGRFSFNPHLDAWHAYLDDDEQATFCTDRVELHTATHYRGERPKYAPDGTPSFIGTIASHSLITPKRTAYKRLFSHPSAPDVVLFDDNHQKPFEKCRRLLLDGSSMWADTKQQKGR